MDRLTVAYRDAATLEEKKRLGYRIQEIVHDEALFIPGQMREFERLGCWRWIRWAEGSVAEHPSKPEPYLRGPITWTWLRAAVALGNSALSTGLASGHLRALNKSRTFKASLNQLRKWTGLSEKATRSGLRRLEEAGLVAEAESLSAVMGAGNAGAWEKYARATFLAHTRNVPADKLRFLQYVTADTAAWWSKRRTSGAVLLGKVAEERGLTAV